MDVRRMPPTTEALSWSFVGEASCWIPADEKERQAVRASNSPGTRYGQSSNTQFRARGFAEREGEVQFKSRLHLRGWLGSTAEGRRPQIRGFRTGARWLSPAQPQPPHSCHLRRC